MDEALDVAELAADPELDDAFVWIFRVIGLLLVLGGLGLWVFTELGFLWLPAVLLVSGLVLLVAPTVLRFLVELPG